MEVMSAEGLKKTYNGRVVVKDVSLNVAQGEVVGLLGPNGAGKTTCFYMMVGLVRTENGSIKMGEANLTEMPLHERSKVGVGYLPQEASIFRELSVEENILSVLELKMLSRSSRIDKLKNLMRDFGLVRIRKSKGRELSGGERRRVEIARALALDPKFILLDEPFAGVDPLAVADIQNIIRDLKKRGIGVLITDHQVRETLGIVERAYIMNQGELLVSGTPDQIIQNETAKKFYLGENLRCKYRLIE